MVEQVRSEFLPTRESLLSRLKNFGDDESWREFFDIYAKLIYTTAVKAGLTDAEAQDAVQETFLSVSKSMPAFQYDPNRGSFKTYLMRLTRWRIKDQLRKRQGYPQYPLHNARESTATDPVERIADPAGCDPAEVWEEEWEQNLFAVALERIKRRVEPKQYQLFDLSVFQGWSVKKIAATLNISPARVYLAKHRISAALRAEVKALERNVPTLLLRPVVTADQKEHSL